MKIKIENLSKKFKDNCVLQNVNLTMESGFIYGLEGRNGSGKSVFLKLICGLYLPSSGHITFDDKEYNFKNEFPNMIGAFIERPSFFPDLTGFENLKLLAKIQNKISDKEIFESLELVNLIDEKDKKYSKYSLGMKQKLGIAQAIMEDREVIILDEPFNGIEEISVKKIKKYLKKKKKAGKLIILSSHIKDDLEEICDKIYYFDNGGVIEK